MSSTTKQKAEKAKVEKVEKVKVEKVKVEKVAAEKVKVEKVKAEPAIVPTESPAETPDSRAAAAAAAAADERRFCSSCSRTKPVLGGVMALCANGTKRWKCADCHARSKAHLASVKKSQ
ncbi:MAG: hypothetical protein B7Y41_07595 [Hydrogenophilales bacterium 28-61-23]|nr:MAG: hypothetical protein B7Y41_07595 [Hydrogenophilales bacterium 28-61-23]